MREKPWVVSFCGEGGNPGLAMAECSPAPSVGLRVLQGAEADRSPLLREGSMIWKCFISRFPAKTHGITFRIQISVKELLDTDVLLKLLFHLPVNYPSTVPDISVNSDQLTRTQCTDVKDKLLEQAKKHLSEPMVHDLILWIQQHLKYVIKQSATVCNEKTTLSKGTSTEDGVWMLLLHLDHMRAKARYVKTVEKWTSDLRLTGRLMFMGKIILILLQGDRSNTKEYLILQKTSKVDVDSSGKKCKEKMISVLCETKVQSQHKRFQTFEVKEYSTLDELQKEFETAGLATLFSEFVPPLLK
nr:PREDICTED: RWD domain-containing protein 3 [Opisthocomus hoazin]